MRTREAFLAALNKKVGYDVVNIFEKLFQLQQRMEEKTPCREHFLQAREELHEILSQMHEVAW